MNDTYLQVLNNLEQWGIDRDVEIGYLLYDWFTHQINVDPNEPPDSINGRIERFLGVIQDNKHITHTKQRIVVEGNEPKWYVQARLTFLGLQYLNEHRLTVSNIQLNASTLDSNRIISQNSTTQSSVLTRQTWILGMVGFFALVSMIVSIMTYTLDNKTKQLSTHIEQLKQDSIKLQNQLFDLRAHLSNKQK